jgi:peptidyl-prolyl cis-trans isomerase A (cyclophilin A)
VLFVVEQLENRCSIPHFNFVCVHAASFPRHSLECANAGYGEQHWSFEMPFRNLLIVGAVGFAALLTSNSSPALENGQGGSTRSPGLLDPTQASSKAPDVFRVAVKTSAGQFTIEVHRTWAPHGADRFFNLVSIGYFQNVAFYRVIDGFMAQFGFHGDPAVNAAWRNARIPVDPVVQSNTRGRVTFAMAGSPDSRTTQLFVNLVDNPYLDGMGFAPIGEIVEGFETVEALYSGYGEGAPRGGGPSQSQIFRLGNSYLEAGFPKLDYILEATLIE